MFAEEELRSEKTEEERDPAHAHNQMILNAAIEVPAALMNHAIRLITNEEEIVNLASLMTQNVIVIANLIDSDHVLAAKKVTVHVTNTSHVIHAVMRVA